MHVVGEGGSEGATPRVEGSSDRCCPGFLDWNNPLEGWNPAAKANASLLQNPSTRSVPQMCSILQQCLYLFGSHREEDR
ncbi:hypothetical protein [Paenibacillus sp. MZ03-122A]|uniref:hypothetical protein n=1 Tax=Paenibacillus sp. MZ03-122A TaxID=2962033 RepID=UPI0020B8449D|nr:hypothetical protein [Paenibacillus sp. MZ03-122A]MCP3780377.1 hypothetical protein [Paenibacillus sp. MZ03-122A]